MPNYIDTNERREFEAYVSRKMAGYKAVGKGNNDRSIMETRASKALKALANDVESGRYPSLDREINRALSSIPQDNYTDDNERLSRIINEWTEKLGYKPR